MGPLYMAQCRIAPQSLAAIARKLAWGPRGAAIDAHAMPSFAQPLLPRRGIVAAVDSSLLACLQRFRPRIKARWASLLHAKLINTPLADPDVLVRMFGSTLDELFRRVRAMAGTHPFAPVPSQEAIRDSCACGCNPLLEYYPSCEQAVLSASTECAGPTGEGDKDATAELQAAIRTIAARDVASFCSLCQHRRPAGAEAADSGAHGNLEFFPMTRETADSWLANAYPQRQPPPSPALAKRGRYGPEE